MTSVPGSPSALDSDTASASLNCTLFKETYTTECQDQYLNKRVPLVE